jgi:hypothetical protein
MIDKVLRPNDSQPNTFFNILVQTDILELKQTRKTILRAFLEKVQFSPRVHTLFFVFLTIYAYI